LCVNTCCTGKGEKIIITGGEEDRVLLVLNDSSHWHQMRQWRRWKQRHLEWKEGRKGGRKDKEGKMRKER
jgi:hypothetical protein